MAFQTWGPTTHERMESGGYYVIVFSFDRPWPDITAGGWSVNPLPAWGTQIMQYAAERMGVTMFGFPQLSIEIVAGAFDSSRRFMYIWFRHAGVSYPLADIRQGAWDWWHELGRENAARMGANVEATGVSIYEQANPQFSDQGAGAGSTGPGRGSQDQTGGIGAGGQGQAASGDGDGNGDFTDHAKDGFPPVDSTPADDVPVPVPVGGSGRGVFFGSSSLLRGIILLVLLLLLAVMGASYAGRRKAVQA